MASKANQVALASQLDKVEVSAELITSEKFSKSYSSLVELMDYLKKIKETVDSGIKTLLEENYQKTGESSMQSDDLSFTYVSPTTKQDFDKKRLKEEHPEIYSKYVKICNVSGSLRVTKKKKESEKEKKKKEAIPADFSDVV